MNEKEKSKSYQVRIDPSLTDKVEKYVNLIKTNKDKKEPSYSKTKFFNELLEEFFSNKVLDKEFIELQKPYYVNTKLLMEEKFSYATTEKPSSDLKTQMVIFKVPNNLDTWNKEYRTFCSEKPNLHEGIKPYLALFNTDKGMKLKIIYHVFKLSFNKEVTPDTVLEVSLIFPEELEIFLNQYEEEVAERLLYSFIEFENNVASDLDSGLTPEEVFKRYDDPTFFRMLTYAQNIDSTINIFSKAVNTMLEIVAEASTNEDIITEEFKQHMEEKGIEKPSLKDIEGYEGQILKNENLVKNGLEKFENGLNSRESRAYIDLANMLEENPDNPFYNILDNINESLKEFDSSEGNVSTNEALENISTIATKEAINLRDNSNMNPETILGFIKESDVPEEVKKAVAVMCFSESEEEYSKKIKEIVSDSVKK